ncbi:hypothetical protein AB1Y20_006292 [Prymnesium parvum]|uniref:Uncharacterized protein n=1 Tax=Prymnesium parvum TaxID=97485 RepID=A0AB34J2B6_PRYPA
MPTPHEEAKGEKFAPAAAPQPAPGPAPRRVFSFGKAPKKERAAAPPPPRAAATRSGSCSAEIDLSKQLHDAQAERRQLLGRIATLQHRLREEVLADCETELEQKEERKEKRLADDDAKGRRAALTHVIAQIERVVESSEQSADSGAGEANESALELEALRLRRDLASVKMEAASAAGRRDEMRHMVAELHKQLMGEARLALKKKKGSMMY